MRYHLFWTNRFEKEYRKAMSRHIDIKIIDNVIRQLESGKKLEEKYKNHKLFEEYEGCYEYHVLPDVLMIYKIQNDIMLLTLLRLGSHSDLF